MLPSQGRTTSSRSSSRASNNAKQDAAVFPAQRSGGGVAGGHHQQQPQHTAAAATAGGGGSHPPPQQHYQQQQQQQQLTAATPPLQHKQPHYQQQQHSQLRPPPARYSSHTSNLGGMHRAGGAGSGGLLPQHTGSAHKPGRSRGGGHSYASAAEEATCTCVLPRTSVLCRLLVAMTVLLVLVQAVSCGMFFCVTLPAASHSRSSSYVDYQELVADISAPSLSSSSSSGSSSSQQLQPQPLAAVPKLIPRVIHQTYCNGRLPASAKAFMRTWAEVNGESWQVRFYSDDAALTFVRREFPEYFEAYLNLPKDVERADFFRYMVVLRLGGAYADIDAECRQPLDSIIQPADTLLVGWDTEVANTTSAAATGLARQRLVANWFFVAAAGHPVLRELCDHIARNAMSTFSRNAVRDTAERTGQGVWTDVVLRHALKHQAAKHDDPWKVRILPRVAFGVRPVGDDAALCPDTPGVVVLHHFAASWQVERHRRLMQALLSWGRSSSQLQDITEPVLPSNVTHFPVSIAFSPPFTLMTDLVGMGDMQAAADVSAMITAHGTWQPGVAPYRKPAVVEALVGALAKHSHRSSSSSAAAATRSAAAATAAVHTPGGDNTQHASTQAAEPSGAADTSSAEAEQAGRAAAAAGSSSINNDSPAAAPHSPTLLAAAAVQLRSGVLVDVGAGQGFFSLAAAARGHRVVAFEASPASLAALKASIDYNGFQELITVHSTALGASAGAVCLQHAEKHGCAHIAAAAAGIAEPPQPQRLHGSSNVSVAASRSRSSRASSNTTAQQQQQQQEEQRVVARAQAQLRRRRGYPWLSDGAALSPAHSCCAVKGSRVRLSDVLSNVSDVAALRVSAHGHEGFILQGALDFLRTPQRRPEVVYVEFWPAAMRAAGDRKPVVLLQSLYDAGYTDIAHAGRVCDERWQNATQSLHLQGTYSAGARMALQQPTWCKLRPEQFAMLADTADAQVPENVMFLLGQAAFTTQSSSGDGNKSSGGSGGSSSSTGRSVGIVSSSSSSTGRSGSISSVKGSSYAAGAAGVSKPQLQRTSAPTAPATVIVQGQQQAALLSPPPSLALPAGSADSSSSSSMANPSNWQPQQPL